MGLWISTPSLAPHETILYRGGSNLFQGRRAIGGQITVTRERVIFVPNRVDAITGGQRRDLARADITAVRISPAGAEAIRRRGLGAAIRPQVEIDHPAGTLVLTVRDVAGLDRALSTAMN